MRHTISNLRSLVATMLLVVTTVSASAGGWVKVTSTDQLNMDDQFIVQSNYNGKYIQLWAMGYEETNVVNATLLVDTPEEATTFSMWNGPTEGMFMFISGPFAIGQSMNYKWNSVATYDDVEWSITFDGDECTIKNDTIGLWKVDGIHDYLYVDGGVNTETPDHISFTIYVYDESIVEEVETEPEPEIIYESEVSFSSKDYSIAIPEYMTYAVTVELRCDVLAVDTKSTICLPFKMTREKIKATFGEGTIVRELTRVENGNLYFEKVTMIEAGVPYMIIPTQIPEDGYYTIEGVNSGSFTTEAKTIECDGYAFRGIFTPEATSGTFYMFNEGRLTKYNSEKTLDGFRGYFYATSAEAKPLHALFAEDETTGISELVVDEDCNKGIYTLSGAKVSSANGLAKGVYVVNGKKVVVK